ncbi:probable aminoglycoside phosphotransferase [Lachnospiraceae bacterium KM106-2]|nr:probable aminoglycoside phosphotransferase [Lachnospiraceae bacterium KM106-2]
MESYSLVDKGGTADIYKIGEKKIFKKFHEDRTDYSIENEYNCTMKVQQFKLGAPMIYEWMKFPMERGFIMEYIKGKNLLKLILEESNNREYYISEWAKLHYRMNSIHTGVFPTGHEELAKRIKNSKAINDKKTQDELLRLLKSLPNKECLCHTDFQPGNIMVTDKGYRIIDWCDTMSDSNWMDVARVMILFEESYVPSGFDVYRVSDFRKLGKEVYLNEYEKLTGKSREELESWMAILAAIKLESENSKDVPVLEKIIYNIL